MATPNRTAILTKMHRVLKKHYKPVPTPQRPVLEHLLYACCLENARYEIADKAYALVSTSFFDWNEVRVSTVKELSEVMHMLPDPAAAASNLKRILQGVFESNYAFELESLLKQTLGQAQQRLKKLEGTTPFSIAYVTQSALGGHAIPVDRGLGQAVAVLGLAGDNDVAACSVAGLERAIAKNKGVEFGSLAHQLGADFVANPYAPALHRILLEINSDAEERLPKRPPKAARPTAERPVETHAEKPVSAEPAKPSKPAALPPEPVPAAKAKPAAAAKKPAAKKPESEKPAAKKKSPAVGLAKRKPR